MDAIVVPYNDENAMESARKVLRSATIIRTPVQEAGASSHADVQLPSGGEGCTLQECEGRLATCAHLQRAHESAYAAASARREQASAGLEEAMHLLRVLQEQERRCHAQCTSSVGTSSQQKKSLILELKRDIAEGDLLKAQAELEKEQQRERAARDQMRKSKVEARVSFQMLERLRAGSPLQDRCTTRSTQGSPRVSPRRMRSDGSSSELAVARNILDGSVRSPRLSPRAIGPEAASVPRRVSDGAPRVSPRRMPSEVSCSEHAVTRDVYDMVTTMRSSPQENGAEAAPVRRRVSDGVPRVSPRRMPSEVSLSEPAPTRNVSDTVTTTRSPSRACGHEADPGPRLVSEKAPRMSPPRVRSEASFSKLAMATDVSNTVTTVRAPPQDSGSEAGAVQRRGSDGAPRASPCRVRSEVSFSELEVTRDASDTDTTTQERSPDAAPVPRVVLDGSPGVSPRRMRSEVVLSELMARNASCNTVTTIRSPRYVVTVVSPRLSSRECGSEAGPVPRRVSDGGFRSPRCSGTAEGAARPVRVSVGFGSSASTGRICMETPRQQKQQLSKTPPQVLGGSVAGRTMQAHVRQVEGRRIAQAGA